MKAQQVGQVDTNNNVKKPKVDQNPDDLAGVASEAQREALAGKLAATKAGMSASEQQTGVEIKSAQVLNHEVHKSISLDKEGRAAALAKTNPDEKAEQEQIAQQERKNAAKEAEQKSIKQQEQASMKAQKVEETAKQYSHLASANMHSNSHYDLTQKLNNKAMGEM
jgi:hypothetical protein